MCWEVENKASLLLFVNEKAKIMREPPFCTCLPPFLGINKNTAQYRDLICSKFKTSYIILCLVVEAFEEQQVLYSCALLYL